MHIFAIFFDFVAQLVEQRTFNPLVPGSNPGEVTFALGVDKE
jgi:hypothetical protein